MKRIYFKNLKEGAGNVFVDVYDNRLREEPKSYAICCGTLQQFEETRDFFERIIPRVFTTKFNLRVIIPNKYVDRIQYVHDGSLAQLVQ